MTATEELRRLLDERGVEWTDFRDQRCVTAWLEPAGAVRADEYDAGLLLVERVMTPEQAVAATLGSGTCRVESMHGYTDPYVSTRYTVELSCHTLEDWPDSEPPSYCPWCGRKVEA